MLNTHRWYQAHPKGTHDQEIATAGGLLYFICHDCMQVVSAEDVNAGNPVGGEDENG